jgi:Uma2 family endonuclease
MFRQIRKETTMTVAVAVTQRPARPDEPEPAWDIARLFPAQGCWSEEDYLALDTNLRVEFADGTVEVQEMPTQRHQLIIAYLLRRLEDFVAAQNLGVVLFAGLRVRLWPGKFREPDVVFMARAHDERRGEQYWEGADLVMEVVSDDRELDLEKKRREYAQAGIPEYWLVDPRDRQIVVLRLDDGSYAVHGVFSAGEIATSVLLAGFAVDVAEVFG